MKIDIYCYSITEDSDALRSSSCGVLLVVGDGRYRHRIYGYTLGSSSEEEAMFRSVVLGLSAVLPGFRGLPACLYICHPEIEAMISSRPKALRWYTYYKDISIEIIDELNNYMLVAKSAAERALKDQENYDSGTIDDLPC